MGASHGIGYVLGAEFGVPHGHTSCIMLPVSPPSVHQMVLTLERAGLIRRQPRTPSSIELLVDPNQLPDLL